MWRPFKYNHVPKFILILFGPQKYFVNRNLVKWKICYTKVSKYQSKYEHVFYLKSRCSSRIIPEVCQATNYTYNIIDDKK